MKVNRQFVDFVKTAKELGWKIYMEPQLRCIDDTWILAKSRTELMFVEEHNCEFDIRKFTRDPFGDYTNIYQPLGSGTGIIDLKKVSNV